MVINSKPTKLKQTLGTDFIFCMIYGKENQLNSFIKSLIDKHNVPVYIGQEFWERFTGDPTFYRDLIFTAGEVAKDIDMKSTVDSVINKLSENIKEYIESLNQNP